LNWVDYAIIGTVLLSMLISLVRGFVREALSLATWILAIMAGIKFSSQMSVFLEPYISTGPIRLGAAFFILFALTLLVGSILSFMLVQLVHKTGLSGTDRSLGVVFGFGRGLLVVSVALLICDMMSFSSVKEDNSSNALVQSQLAPRFEPIMVWLKQFLPETSEAAKAIDFQGLSE